MSQKNPLEIIKEGLGPYPLSPVIAAALKFILSNRYESLVIVNANGEIEYLDRGTEKLLKLTPGKAKGEKIKDIMPFSELDEVVLSGIPHIGKVFTIQNTQRIVSRFCLKNNEKVLGAFGKVVLHSIEELEKVRQEAEKLRNDLLMAKRSLDSQLKANYTFDNILGVSAEIIKVKTLAGRMAETRGDISIQGESGTGKELFSHAIHNASQRKSYPFIRVNCPAIPLEIAESELFGYEQGAFTGAIQKGKPGKFELAEGGTIFLDEIGSLPLTIQAKLLRVLQEREVERLGSKKVIKLNFRLISATNTDLRTLVQEGKFRSDLFFRLSKGILRLPPLRDRIEDIATYTSHFLKLLNRNFDIQVNSISKEAFDILNRYQWPGNVRELSNILEQSLFNMVGNERIVRPEHLPNEIKKKIDLSYKLKDGYSMQKLVDEFERDLIFDTLKNFNGNKKKTASFLGIHRSVLYLKLNKWGYTEQ